MANKKKPALITPKGVLNVGAWTKWHMHNKGLDYLKAHRLFNEKVRDMPEPPLATEAGKPNPVWVTWYRIRNKVSGNVATGICRNRIMEASTSTSVDLGEIGMRRIKYLKEDGTLVDVSLADFTMDQRKELNNAVNAVFFHCHENTGVSMSWLRRLAHELDKFDLNMSFRKLVLRIIEDQRGMQTWDEVIGVIRPLLSDPKLVPGTTITFPQKVCPEVNVVKATHEYMVKEESK